MAITIKNQTISADDNGIRLDRWFKRHHSKVSFTVLAKFIRKGQVRINGKRAEIGTRLTAGDQIRFPDLTPYMLAEQDVRGPNPSRLIRMAEELQKNIIFQNEDFIVLNKPYGLAAQNGSKTNVSVDSLTEFWKLDGEQKPKLVHRIDKETTGLMILARSSSMAATLSDMMRKRQIEKLYFAVLQGLPKPTKGKIDIPIAKDCSTKYEEVKPKAGGDRAITEYEVLDNALNVMSIVRMKLVTGRTHQLRVHSAAIGCPIIGDGKYNKTEKKIRNIEDKLHLHSHIMRFNLKGKDYEFIAPYPSHIQNTLDICFL